MGKVETPGPAVGLRARKKAMTRESLESAALRMFLDRGYDQVRLEDICEACTVSIRTYFRYFTSKEDLVLGHLREHLSLAQDLFARRPPQESTLTALHAVIREICHAYTEQSNRELARLRVVSATPALEAPLNAVFAGFDQLVRTVAEAHPPAGRDPQHAKLVAAAAVAAFRVGLEIWVATEAGPDLADLVLDNLDKLTVGVLGAATSEERPPESRSVR
ncbi:TetR/AcrR family transcriptional regulator [Amycolatopsis taiwanensis]|uniref:TetR family transcriptional regulator n=2 Tax=Amycolatopsis taiwanensis TaxID=342230 RepID=A0A9W6QYZ6_9PSEU|nr:TetR/AcrR family transcriptional regulator [Amycolatopsis taiwanensis]GLY65430.1 TetR family transcriptional regulator [Amycolatopsis taiwanensis]